MRRYSNKQIQDKLENLKIGHRLVLDGKYHPRYYVECKCNKCNMTWTTHISDVFIGCPYCYAGQPNEKKVYIQGMKIGHWTLNKRIKDENGSVTWECRNENDEVQVFNLRQLKYMRANGIPPYGSKSYETRKLQSCTSRGIDEAEFTGFWNETFNRGRSSLRYKQFKAGILQRDGYVCVKCGICGLHDESIRMQIHHLDNIADNEDLMYDPNNVVTLCEKCHKSTYKGAFHYVFGTKNNTKEQFETWLSGEYEIDAIIATGLKAVEQLDMDGKVLQRFRCGRDAARYIQENIAVNTKLNTCYKLIGDICRKRPGYHSAYGFKWRFYEDDTNNNEC